MPETLPWVPTNSSLREPRRPVQLLPNARQSGLPDKMQGRGSPGKATLGCVHAAREDDEGNGGQGSIFETWVIVRHGRPPWVSHVAAFAAERLVTVPVRRWRRQTSVGLRGFVRC